MSKQPIEKIVSTQYLRENTPALLDELVRISNQLADALNSLLPDVEEKKCENCMYGCQMFNDNPCQCKCHQPPHTPVVEGWENRFRKKFINSLEKVRGDWMIEFFSDVLTSARSEERQKRDELWIEMLKKFPTALNQLQGEIALMKKLNEK